jgi:hypothetical protein
MFSRIVPPTVHPYLGDVIFDAYHSATATGKMRTSCGGAHDYAWTVAHSETNRLVGLTRRHPGQLATFAAAATVVDGNGDLQRGIPIEQAVPRHCPLTRSNRGRPAVASREP